MTGNMPGKAASTGETWVFGSAPNWVAAPENSLALETTWAWTSSPITVSHCPVRPSIMLHLLHSFCPLRPLGGEGGGPARSDGEGEVGARRALWNPPPHPDPLHPQGRRG